MASTKRNADPSKISEILTVFRYFQGVLKYIVEKKLVNLLSANPTKWSNTLKQLVGDFPTNCLSVFDHFVGLALRGLRYKSIKFFCCLKLGKIVRTFLRYSKAITELSYVFSREVYFIPKFFKNIV